MNTFWDRCYLEHYQRFFGKPFDRQTFRPDADGPPLEILIYDQRYPDYRVFASRGLTAYEDSTKQLAEVILISDQEWKEMPLILVNALFFIARSGIALEPGFAIGGVDKLAPRLAEKFGKTALYFNVVAPADKFPPGFEVVRCGEDLGLIYQAIFIAPDEHDLIRRRGVDAFEERLRPQQADLRQLARPSCV
jgi:hypothetical protein